MVQSNANHMQATMADILGGLSGNLARYLEKILPSLFEDWWNKGVVNILSFQQQRRVKERGISSIATLDLAALLRVLDQNWYQISTKMELPSEARHFVKEMQTVRNRWAHADSQGFPVDDIYRDLDTLQRFAIVVEADKSLLDKVRKIKATLLFKVRTSQDQEGTVVERASPKASVSDSNSTPDQIVHLKCNPVRQSTVVSTGIERIHEDIYQRLIHIRQENPHFYFMPRRRKDARLKKGYWFLGNEHYLSVSFWSGTDTKNKTANISFTVIPPGSRYLNMRGGCSSFIQLTARDSTAKKNFLARMTKEIPGFEVFRNGEWNKRYGSTNYLVNLEEFLTIDKPQIDKFIGNHNIEGLSLLGDDSLKFLKNIEEIKSIR